LFGARRVDQENPGRWYTLFPDLIQGPGFDLHVIVLLGPVLNADKVGFFRRASKIGQVVALADSRLNCQGGFPQPTSQERLQRGLDLPPGLSVYDLLGPMKRRRAITFPVIDIPPVAYCQRLHGLSILCKNRKIASDPICKYGFFERAQVNFNPGSLQGLSPLNKSESGLDSKDDSKRNGGIVFIDPLPPFDLDGSQFPTFPDPEIYLLSDLGLPERKL